MLRTGDVELRLPDEADLLALADLAAQGVHDPEAMPFVTPWTDGAPDEVAERVLRHHWGLWSRWSPDAWSLELVVRRAGEVVGVQEVMAEHFAVLREVGTGSWLGRHHQGRGTGRAMRAAVLHLAFAGLGAHAATSSAFEDNPASLAVSAALGYRPDGTARVVRRGAAATDRRLRLTREDWEATARPAVEVGGLEACRDWFGA